MVSSLSSLTCRDRRKGGPGQLWLEGWGQRQRWPGGRWQGCMDILGERIVEEDEAKIIFIILLS